MTYDLQTLQLALTHLLAALRLVERLGATTSGAHIDLAIHALRHDVEKQRLGKPRSLDSNVDFSHLEAIAVELVDHAISEANPKAKV